MAIKLLTTTSDLSTSGGNYEQVEAYNLAGTLITAANQWIALNTTRTINVTFANAGNQQAILFYVRNATTGTLTIKLFEGATERTSDTFNLSTTYSSDNFVGFKRYPLTSYAVTTASSTWSYQISCTSATPLVLVTTASGTDIVYAVTCDVSSTKVGSGDALFLGEGVTLTIDENLTLAPVDGRSLFTCITSVLTWENPPSTAITLDMGGGAIYCSNDFKMYVGSEANPIPVSEKATILNWGSTFGGTTSTYWRANSFTALNRNVWEFWGEEPTYCATRIAANALAGQADIVTTVDMDGIWSVGDTVSLIGKKRRGNDGVEYTISAISGTTITLSANLDYDLLKGGGIVNLDRRDGCGIWIDNSALSSWTFIATNILTYYMKVVGVYLDRLGIFNTTGWQSGVDTNLVRNIVVHTRAVQSYTFYSAAMPKTVVDGVYVHSTDTNYRTGGVIVSGGCHNSSIKNIYTKNCYSGSLTGSGSGLFLSSNNTTVETVVLAHGRVRADITLYPYTCTVLSGAGNTVTDLWVYAGGTNIGVTFYNLYASTVNDLYVDGAGHANIALIGSLDVQVDGELSTNDPATTAEIYTYVDTLNRVVFNQVPVGASTLVDNFDAGIATSYLAFQDYNNEAGEHRYRDVYGNIRSTGDGLEDTTVHTSGTGKYALRMEPVNSTNNLEWDFTVPTGNIQNQTMTIFAWVKINSATYYAGTHQLPRLRINYDNGTTAYAQAAENTDWQILYVAFTPTTTYGQITVTVSGRTDATSTDAYFYIDDFGISYPPNVALDLGGLDNWSGGLPVVPPIALPISAGTVAQQVALNVPGEIKYIDGGEIPLY